MIDQVLQLWERLLTDNTETLSALYEAITPYLTIFMGVGVAAVACSIIILLFRGK